MCVPSQSDEKSKHGSRCEVFSCYLKKCLWKVFYQFCHTSDKLPTAHKISYCLVNPELFSFPNKKIIIIFSMNMKGLHCQGFFLLCVFVCLFVCYMGVFLAFISISSMWFKAWEREGTENCCFELWNFDTESILDFA